MANNLKSTRTLNAAPALDTHGYTAADYTAAADTVAALTAATAAVDGALLPVWENAWHLHNMKAWVTLGMKAKEAQTAWAGCPETWRNWVNAGRMIYGMGVAPGKSLRGKAALYYEVAKLCSAEVEALGFMEGEKRERLLERVLFFLGAVEGDLKLDRKTLRSDIKLELTEMGVLKPEAPKGGGAGDGAGDGEGDGEGEGKGAAERVIKLRVPDAVDAATMAALEARWAGELQAAAAAARKPRKAAGARG